MMASCAQNPLLGALFAAMLFLGGCLKAASTLTLVPTQGTPADARVTIDEEFVGTLGFVAARGVRLPSGEHHISVEREGYFPYDVIVVSKGGAIPLDVKLVRLPE
jgi:hypothetical protein